MEHDTGVREQRWMDGKLKENICILPNLCIFHDTCHTNAKEHCRKNTAIHSRDKMHCSSK